MSEENWKDSLPEGFADAPFLKAAESPEAALQAITDAADYMGNSIRVPSENAGEEDVAAFYDKILSKAPNLMPRPDEDNMDAFYKSVGRPDKPEEYSYEAPDGKEVPEDFSTFAAVAHKHGLSQTQFRGILGDLLGPQWAAMETAENDQKEALSALAGEWGFKFDEHMNTVKNFLRLTDAPAGLVELISEGAMSTDEIKWLHNIASQTKSQVELNKQPASQPEGLLSPEEARMQISEMLNNPDHPYWVATDPAHQAAVQKMLKLQQMANPSATTDMSMMRA